MPRIDFYIVEDSEPKAHYKLACRLIEKAYKNRHRLYVHTNNEAEAHYLDELLWTYRDDSFLPHNLYGDGPEPAPPIQIGYHQTPDKQRDILITLSLTAPEFYTQFNRVLVIVASNPEAQTAAREHYRLYRSQGHDINTHKLQTIE